MNASTRGIKSVRRVSEIVELLKSEGPLSTTEVANALDCSRSTAHEYLTTLCEVDYVVSGPGGYNLSLKFLDPGIQVRNSLPVATIGGPVITQLAKDTNEATWLIVEEHGKAVYAKSALGDRAVQTRGRIGKRAYLHALAAGKLILAHLPEDRVEEIIDEHGLPKQTDQTITSRSALYEELETIREQGYAVNDQELLSGGRAISAPIIVDGNVEGAISVSGPANRITDDRVKTEILPELLAAANELELRLDAAT